MKLKFLKFHLAKFLPAFLALSLVLVIAAVFTSQASAALTTETYKTKKTVAKEVIIKFKSINQQTVENVRKNQDADNVEALNGGGIYLLHSRSKNVSTLIQELLKRSDIEYVEPNYILQALGLPNDPSFGSLWGLQNTGQNNGCGSSCYGSAIGAVGADIKATSAWDVSTGSTGNVVAVVDTGINYNHPDLAANVWSAPSSFSVKIGSRTITCAAGTHGFNAINNTCNPLDDNNHGSHVSGTIGAVGNNGIGVTGINWTTRIMGAKFLNSGGSGTLANAINAIEFTIQAKAAFAGSSGANVRILSNSWGGGGFSQALQDEINKANSNEMLFVAAAGNSSANNDTVASYPANYNLPNVISVAATNNKDTLASFSNYGASKVQLGAPGVDVLSTLINGYGYYSGTSMATPHVSGAAALVLSKCSLNTNALKSNLLNNVDALSALSGKVSTGGRLNVDKAIRACSVPAAPDFGLSTSPQSATVTQGNSANYTVNIAPLGGFNSSVSLSVSGLPANTSYSFNPNPASGNSSTLSIATNPLTPTGTYTLIITGANGSLSHTTTITLVVQAPPPPQTPDFMVSISPSSRSVSLFGGNVSYTVSISKSGGFNNPVSFSVSGLPSGVTTSFSANPSSENSVTLTVKAASNTAAGSYLFTVTATGGSPQINRQAKATFVKRNSFF